MLFDEKIEAIVIFLLCLSTAFPISNAAIDWYNCLDRYSIIVILCL